MAAPQIDSGAFARFLSAHMANPHFLNTKGCRKSPSDPDWVMDYNQPIMKLIWNEESIRRIPKTGFRMIEITKPKGKKGEKAAWMLKAGQKTAEKGHAKMKKAGKVKKFKLDLHETECKRVDERIEEWFATEEFLKANNLKTNDFKPEWHKGPSGHFSVPNLHKPRHNMSVEVPDTIKEHHYGTYHAPKSRHVTIMSTTRAQAHFKRNEQTEKKIRRAPKHKHKMTIVGVCNNCGDVSHRKNNCTHNKHYVTTPKDGKPDKKFFKSENVFRSRESSQVKEEFLCLQDSPEAEPAHSSDPSQDWNHDSVSFES